MKPEETLEVLRAQYHDFLNHLQVISGLLELGRHEKVKEYLSRVAEEFAARGRVAKAGLPEVAWMLLRFQAESLAAGVKVSCDLQRAAGEGQLPSRNLAEHLKRLHTAIIARAVGSGEERSLTVTGRSVPGGYLLTYAGAFPWEEIVGGEEASFTAAGIGLRVCGQERIELYWRDAAGEA